MEFFVILPNYLSTMLFGFYVLSVDKLFMEEIIFNYQSHNVPFVQNYRPVGDNLFIIDKIRR